MAERIEPPIAAPGASDASILFPDRKLVVGGRELVVREFRFLEGFEALDIAAPFLDELRALIKGGEPPSVVEIRGLIRRHRKIWVRLIAMACDQPVEWVAGLSNADGWRIQEAFWRANAFFFISQLSIEAAMEHALARAASRSGSPKSSSSSSAPASGGTTTTSPAGSPGDKSSATPS